MKLPNLTLSKSYQTRNMKRKDCPHWSFGRENLLCVSISHPRNRKRPVVSIPVGPQPLTVQPPKRHSQCAPINLSAVESRSDSQRRESRRARNNYFGTISLRVLWRWDIKTAE